MCLNIYIYIFFLVSFFFFSGMFSKGKAQPEHFHLPLAYFLGVPQLVSFFVSICISSCYSTKRKRWKHNVLF